MALVRRAPPSGYCRAFGGRSRLWNIEVCCLQGQRPFRGALELSVGRIQGSAAKVWQCLSRLEDAQPGGCASHPTKQLPSANNGHFWETYPRGANATYNWPTFERRDAIARQFWSERNVSVLDLPPRRAHLEPRHARTKPTCGFGRLSSSLFPRPSRHSSFVVLPPDGHEAASTSRAFGV